MKPLTNYIKTIIDGQQKTTLLGIGPVSKSVIEASLELANNKNFPIMYIASRNQVDSDEFGSGYVNNWNQKRFVDDIRDIANMIGFHGDYYICRDHGGPWQRDKEQRDKVPKEKALIIAKRSYTEDIKAGFDLLHIDPTKIPGYKIAPIEEVIDLTVELIDYCEQEKKIYSKKGIIYEVGTEETNGGLTEDDDLENFIQILFARLEQLNLPKPAFIVGQTGTLVKMTENVGTFNLQRAGALSALARKYGLGLKEHNCDYLPFDALCLHPALGVTASNVAPEFGYVETCALLGLYSVEQQLLMQGYVDKVSNLYNVLVKKSLESGRWKKWTVDEIKENEILKNPAMLRKIVYLAGHYTFNEKEIIQEREKMYQNLKNTGLNPHRIVIEEIKKSIDKYVVAFNLENRSR